MEDPVVEVSRGEYVISTDRNRLDVDAVHAYLVRSYWAQGVPREVVAKSIRGSLCFCLSLGGRQVGFARVVTDQASFAYLCDVYVLEEHRGKGLSKWLLETVLAYPGLQQVRRFALVTRDAHGLYERYGFAPLSDPRMHMEIFRPGIYRNTASGRT